LLLETNPPVCAGMDDSTLRLSSGARATGQCAPSASLPAILPGPACQPEARSIRPSGD